MAIAFRANLQPFLAEFIEHRRGLRIGRMFGLPAGYAGRKMFVCLIEDGLRSSCLRMWQKPKCAREDAFGNRDSGFGIRDSNPESRASNPGSVWVKYVPRNAREAARLAPVLEAAARYVVGV